MKNKLYEANLIYDAGTEAMTGSQVSQDVGFIHTG